MIDTMLMVLEVRELYERSLNWLFHSVDISLSTNE